VSGSCFAERELCNSELVWGPAKIFTTTKANVAKLEIPGSLVRPEILSQIPNTIKDAINLIEYLGERYLWVDALCIVQDDEDWKYSQINNMASIFANSHLTIIAADGDSANYGLRGLKGISEPRALDQHIHQLTSRMRVARVLDMDRYRRSTWGKRGWTFQEDIFSTRRLRFRNQLVEWECDHHVLKTRAC